MTDLIELPKLSDFLSADKNKYKTKLLREVSRIIKNVDDCIDNKMMFLPISFGIPPEIMLYNNKSISLIIYGTLLSGKRAAIFLSDYKLFFIDIIIDRDETIIKGIIKNSCCDVITCEKMTGHYINKGFSGKDTTWYRVYFNSCKGRAKTIQNLGESSGMRLKIASNDTSLDRSKDIGVVLSKCHINTGSWLMINNANFLSGRNKTIYPVEIYVEDKNDLVSLSPEQLHDINIKSNAISMVYDIECVGRNAIEMFPDPSNIEDVINSIAVTFGT
ncbi:MAG: hypothetical protein KDH96_07035, partial [Candidatus Riesia sp.]|nr:hypothetical protein [Candidatus Riesia sp.]